VVVEFLLMSLGGQCVDRLPNTKWKLAEWIREENIALSKSLCNLLTLEKVQLFFPSKIRFFLTIFSCK